MRFSFIQPILLQAETTLPQGWLYELDGYRATRGEWAGHSPRVISSL